MPIVAFPHGYLTAAATMLAAALSAASAQNRDPAATTGVAPADRLFNNAQPSLAGQTIPSSQQTAAHNAAIYARDKLPTLAHTFNFTVEQTRHIHDALAAERNAQGGPVALVAGTVLPSDIAFKPMPEDIVQVMPWVRSYGYVQLDGRIAIVDPNLRAVVAVIE